MFGQAFTIYSLCPQQPVTLGASAPTRIMARWWRQLVRVILYYKLRPRSIVKILLIDHELSGPTSKMVEGAVQQQSHRRGTTLEYELVRPAEVFKRLEPVGPEGAVILVSITEPALSMRQIGEKGQRVACASLSMAQALAARPKTPTVFLLRQSDQPPLSAVDVIAGMLSGIGGVLDERTVPCDGLLRALFDHRPIAARTRTIFVVGRSAETIRQVKNMLRGWDEQTGWDGRLDQACWRTAMALAQLDRLLPLPSAGDRYSFVKLAEALNLRSALTSFRLSVSDLRKVMSMLAGYWNVPDGDQRTERIHLPTYAQKQGFPQHPPAIAGWSDEELPKRLYDAARAMDLIEREPISGQIPRILVRAPIRLLTRPARNRQIQNPHSRNNNA
jgi:hypothetical protein